MVAVVQCEHCVIIEFQLILVFPLAQNWLAYTTAVMSRVGLGTASPACDSGLGALSHNTNSDAITSSFAMARSHWQQWYI